MPPMLFKKKHKHTNKNTNGTLLVMNGPMRDILPDIKNLTLKIITSGSPS